MASSAAACGRSRGKEVSFIAEESTTGGDDAGTGEELPVSAASEADAALESTTSLHSSRSTRPARRLPRGGERERVPGGIGGDTLVRFTAFGIRVVSRSHS